MDFGVLGPLLVESATGPVTLGSPKQRALLATLLLQAPDTLVTTERLIDELWGEHPPATAGKALSVHVSQLRRALGPNPPIVTRPGGYAFQSELAVIDVHRFDALLANARRLRSGGEAEAALLSLQEALGLWRGPALADVTLLGPGAAEADRLEGLRAVAREERIELELARGEGHSLVPELEALIANDPYREHLHALLMRALYRAGRQADALDAFRRARTLLVEDLGLDPGDELIGLEAAILAHDAALAAPVPTVVDGTQRMVPRMRAGRVPAPAGPTFGREVELALALSLVDRPEIRLMTVTGAGGIGKTRLALELALRLKQRSHLVELAAISDPERVISAIAGTVGAEDASEQAISMALGHAPVVLFLDNFEQVLAAAPSVVSLVAVVPQLTVVVTSRAPLNVAIEHELPLPPLPHDSAIEVFVERAREQDPQFSPDSDDREYIATICARLDRLPLAIELAAARTRVLTLDQILERLGHRLQLLTASHQDAPARHQTLRATIAWSHDLLSAEEQRLFARFGVFPTGWSVEAAEEVAGRPALDALSTLVEHGLVVRDGPRFRMLETVREYALERLEESGESRAVARRHALWCRTLAAAAERDLDGPQPHQASWFAQLDLEQESLRAALAWAIAQGEPETALALIAALWRFWFARGVAGEFRDPLSAALESGAGDATLRSKGLNAAGVLAAEAGDLATAQRSFAEALDLAQRAGDNRQAARVLMNLGVTSVYTSDYTTALGRYHQAAAIFQELGDLRGESIMLENLGIIYGLRGDFDQALPVLEQSVELARAAGDQLHLASALIELGRLLVQHAVSDARIPAFLREGLERADAFDERIKVIQCLEVLGAFHAQSGAPALGAELIGAADAERQRLNFARKPDEGPFFAATTQMLGQALNSKEYERAHARGLGMSLEAAILEALKSTSDSDRPPQASREEHDARARVPEVSDLESTRLMPKR
jgi:predicted ATPase/DNA-binding SARP family transcriptional activator